MTLASVVWALLAIAPVHDEAAAQPRDQDTRRQASQANRHESPENPQPTPVSTYTNADLERVRPLRGQTGGSSQPAHQRLEAGGQTRRQQAAAARHTEDFWRREAQKLRERFEAYEDEIVDLRDKIETLRKDPRVLPYSDPRIERWQERIATLERRREERWERFRTRARRAQVPPGWLR
jgi:hypothetical protein